jgi:hypothetical protein
MTYSEWLIACGMEVRYTSLFPIIYPNSNMDTTVIRFHLRLIIHRNRDYQQAPNSILSKTWEFSPGRTLRLALKQKDWMRIRKFLEPGEMTSENAAKIRTVGTLAPA